MNKKLILVILIATSLCTSSCKKFFEVNPKTEVPKDELFKTESGFKDALTGVYIQLKEDNAYGMAMTMSTMEYLVSSWDVSNNSAGYWLGLFNYQEAGAETALANIYRQLYKVIASINEILTHIDNKKEVFSPGLYEMIKGECLALRAYCHFDILRLFGPIPSQPSVGNSLPYVKLISKNQNALLPFENYKSELLNDLADAALLLKEDPFIKYSSDDFKKAVYRPLGDFTSHRYLRMNYYAVKGLQARAYLWFNQKDKAFESAKSVIEAKNQDGTSKFRLGRSNDMSAKDYVLTSEHIFGLYDFQLYTKHQKMFASGNYRKGSNETLIRTQLYGNTGTDIREANLWEQITISSVSSYILRKYQVPETTSQSNADINQIPMLRLSEMYLIAAETAPIAEARIYWDDFKRSRNVAENELPSIESQKQSEIVSEYRREFYGEGQSFFAYKRLNTDKSEFLFVPPSASINYLLPMPKIETTIIK